MSATVHTCGLVLHALCGGDAPIGAPFCDDHLAMVPKALRARMAHARNDFARATAATIRDRYVALRAVEREAAGAVAQHLTAEGVTPARVAAALATSGGNVSAAARSLGVARSTIRRHAEIAGSQS